jgi:hypothetical protein
MATYVPAKRATELIFYIPGLISQANTKVFQTNPTLAAGDVKISKDGGATANLTTLPVVTPAGGASIKVTVSVTEMTADNVTITFRDAAGAEWCDLGINIPTAARQIDDLAASSTALTNATWTDTKAGYLDAAITSRLASGNVTVGGYAAGQTPADSVLVTPANKLATNASGYVTKVTVDGYKKNTAVNNFMFKMVDSADHVTGKTGLTVTATRSIDGAAFAACANSVTEITSGWYDIDFAATDMNGDVIAFEFTATGADARSFTLKTNT